LTGIGLDVIMSIEVHYMNILLIVVGVVGLFAMSVGWKALKFVWNSVGEMLSVVGFVFIVGLAMWCGATGRHTGDVIRHFVHGNSK
jgi:hypothetical protein